MSKTESIELRPVSGNSLKEVMALGAVFKASGYFKDIRDEAQAVTKILYGREMGFTPIVSIMGIYIIEGKPSLSANLLATLVKRSGKYDYRIKENTATRCAILFRVRNDAGQWENLGESEFTIDEAKTAGVANKDNWRKYPKAMLFARCLSAGVRTHCPDVTICPMYVPEELGANTTEDGEPISEFHGLPIYPTAKPEPPAATVEPRTITKPMQEIRREVNYPNQGASDTVANIKDILKDSAGSNNGQGNSQEGTRRPEPAKTADKIEKAIAFAEASQGSDAEAAVKAADAFIGEQVKKESRETPGCINKGQAINFARSFKDALNEELRKDASKYEHDWLRVQGFVDAAGEPTAYAIPKVKFYDIRDQAEKWARGL